MTYLEFLKTKIEVAPVSGFTVDPSALSPVLKPHQRDAVVWALAGGRRALFESFGLGKTLQELEYCRLVLQHEGGKALIVLPLGVRQEFRRDAVQLLGMEEPRYITSPSEATEVGKIYLTNYERVRDGEIDPKDFTACVLDEAAVLRSFGSKTYQTFLPKFKGVKYKLVATATPAPNRLKELIHYAGFLEVMDTGQALTRFFQRDSTKANNLTLYPHKEEEFWLWVSSWALFISKPSDLGYDDEGYALPPMDVRPHMISRGYEGITDKDGQYKLMNDAATSLQEAAREKKDSIAARCAMAKEIVDSDPDAHFILWHDREEEHGTFDRRAVRNVRFSPRSAFSSGGGDPSRFRSVLGARGKGVQPGRGGRQDGGGGDVHRRCRGGPGRRALRREAPGGRRPSDFVPRGGPHGFCLDSDGLRGR